MNVKKRVKFIFILILLTLLAIVLSVFNKNVGFNEKDLNQRQVYLKEHTENVDIIKTEKAGVILTFDDKSIDLWYEARHLFNKYGAKITFFLCNVDDLTDEQTQKVLELQAEGHEFGSHGLKHLNAVDYVNENSIEDYINDEILPSIEIMKSKGLVVKSFSYPFGASNENIDEKLKENFSIIRKTSYCSDHIQIKDMSNVYYSPKETYNIVYGVGIDKIYENSSSEIIQAIDFAKEKGLVLILYGHQIMNSGSNDEYSIESDELEKILKHVYDNEVKFYTISQLAR